MDVITTCPPYLLHTNSLYISDHESSLRFYECEELLSLMQLGEQRVLCCPYSGISKMMSESIQGTSSGSLYKMGNNKHFPLHRRSDTHEQ